jgi:predicted Zn-dependent protease with MMP-like domain
MRPVSPRTIAGSAAAALCIGIAFVTLMQGFSADFPVRLIQGTALFVAGALVLFVPIFYLAMRLADWRDPMSEREFDRIVERSERLARDDLAVVISDGGQRRGAYGLYHGDGVSRDDVPDRIVIYRDTLRRDFGHDPDELRAQVVRTVRHELAHHLGWDELGVRDLGL